jgi:HEAT repeat protein
MPHAAHVAEFVRALALGWKNLAAYPPGHPVLAGALAQLHARLEELRGPAGDVVFGIAADGLIAGGEKVSTPQAQKFASALYTRGVAVLRFDSSTTPSDLETFLRLLGVGAKEADKPIFEQLPASGVTSISLQAVDYSAVEITDSLDAPRETRRESDESLWDSIVRALAEGDRIGNKGPLQSVRSIDQLSALLSHYIDVSEEEAAPFDADATFGVQTVRVPETSILLAGRVGKAVEDYLAKSTGLHRQFVLGQITQLLRTLPEALRAAVIRAVLRVVATDESTGALLRDFTTPLTRDEIIEGLRRLGTAVSSHALGLLRSLMEVAPAASRPAVGGKVAIELSELFGDEDVDRFNPEDHAALLDDLVIEIPTIPKGIEANPGRLGDRVTTIADEMVNRQVAHTVLDMHERHGNQENAALLLTRAERCFQNFVAGAQFSDAIDVVRRLRMLELSTKAEDLRKAVNAILGNLAAPEAIQHLVTGLQSAQKENAALVQKLIDALGTAAAQNLLVALAEENNRSRRRRLFDFVCSLGPTVVPVATSFLSDSRWYVVRNMIVVLRTVGDRSSLQQIRRSAHHPDLRVRLEAIKTLLAFDSSVPSSLLDEAINHPDPKLAETAMTLVASYGIKEAVGPLLKILDGRDVIGAKRTLRIRAIKALGELAEPAALAQLERFFRDPFLPWPSLDERRAAFESLATYPAEARQQFIEIGLTSRDPQIRSICQRLAPREGESWKR